MTFDAQQHIDDEFRFLTSDAEHVAHTGPLPQVARLSVPLPDGRTLSLLQFGRSPSNDEPADSQAPEVVFLHGMGLNAHSFDRTVLALGRPALSIDLAGHGRSDWRADANYRPDQLAEDVVIALDELAPAPVILVGHSLGALTAIAVAALRPNALRSLVLLDLTPGVTPSSDAAGVNEFIAGQRSFDSIDEIVDRAIRFEIGSDRAALTRGVALNTRVRPDGKIEWTHHFAHLLPDPGEVEAQAAATATTPPPAQPYAGLWEPLSQLSRPITLIYGTTGMVSKAMLTEWARRLPEATVKSLETGHNVHEQDPVGLANALIEIDRQVTER